MVRIARSAALARTPSQSRHHPAQRALFNPPCPGVLAAKIVEPVEVALATILPVDGRRRVVSPSRQRLGAEGSNPSNPTTGMSEQGP